MPGELGMKVEAQFSFVIKALIISVKEHQIQMKVKL